MVDRKSFQQHLRHLLLLRQHSVRKDSWNFRIERDLGDHIGQGFSSQHYWHLGLDNSLLWGSPCTVGCLAASLASLHQMSVATSNFTQVVTVKDVSRVSLAVQWLGIHLAMQGTWVRSLIWEDPTCFGITKPVCCNYWAWWAPEPVYHKERESVRKILHDAVKIPCASTKTRCSQTNIYFLKFLSVS